MIFRSPDSGNPADIHPVIRQTLGS
jgi:hypothetical protein